jgi:hypothetical protein
VEDICQFSSSFVTEFSPLASMVVSTTPATTSTLDSRFLFRDSDELSGNCLMMLMLEVSPQQNL